MNEAQHGTTSGTEGVTAINVGGINSCDRVLGLDELGKRSAARLLATRQGARGQQRLTEKVMTTTIAESLAAQAAHYRFESLPPEVVNKAKQLVLHAIGGAFAGHRKEPSRIMESLGEVLGNNAIATIWAGGPRTSLLHAVLANVTKCSGSGDKCYPTPEARFHVGAQSQLIPGIFAVGEQQHSSGKEILSAVVAAYELANKMYAAVGGNFGLLDNGWSTDVIGRPGAMALVAGRLLGFSEVQLAHALGIAGSFTLVPFIVYSPTTQHSPELRTSMALMNAVLSAILAWKGMTGPLDVFEGRYGLSEMATGGKMDFDKLREPHQDWTILYTGVNTFAGDPDMAGFIEAAATLATEHDIKPENVRQVVVKTTAREARRLGDPSAEHIRHPTTAEWARHSCFYVTSVAIVYRGSGHEQFTDEVIRNPDPRVSALMEKVSVESDPEFEGFNLRGSAEITTKDGQVFYRKVLQPRGLHPLNPLTDSDNEKLFRRRAGTELSEGQMQSIINAVQKLDALDDIGELTRLLSVSA
jgi:2-methylcitrate dehydratase